MWAEVYLAGTEWDQLEEVRKYDWDFSHLDEALMEGGMLFDSPLVHIFGCTEPQLIKADEKDENGTLIPVPVMVVIASKMPPPATVGIDSVQRKTEEIVPMSKIRMGWHARLPDNAPLRNPPKPKLHILKCNERKARLRNMDEAAVHKYDYVLPYIIRPGQEEEDVIDTSVQVLVDNLEGRSNPVMLEFDWELDELDEFVEEQIKDQELDMKKHEEPVKKAIREAVRAQKLKFKAERDAKKSRIDALSDAEKDSVKTMKVYKFYPSNEEDKYPDVTQIKSPFVNRYYGKADGVH